MLLPLLLLLMLLLLLSRLLCADIEDEWGYLEAIFSVADADCAAAEDSAAGDGSISADEGGIIIKF